MQTLSDIHEQEA